MLLTVPNELLVEIMKYLAHDLQALQCSALVCRSLLPIVREQLFTSLSICGLDQLYMRPYLLLIRHIYVGTRGHGTLALRPDILSSLNPQDLPNLTAFTFVRDMSRPPDLLPPPVYEALARFSTVTDLSLCNARFLHRAHMLSLLSALPNISTLSFHHVDYTSSPDPEGGIPVTLTRESDDRVTTVQLRLSRLSILSRGWRMPPGDMLNWIENGPTQKSLKTLTIPRENTLCRELIRVAFGPSVEHLTIPMKDDLPDLGTYVSLRSLVASVDLHNSRDDRDLSHLLVRLFRSVLTRADHLHTVTIIFCLDHCHPHLVPSELWSTLLGVETELISEKFDTLRTVEVVVLWERHIWGEELEASVEYLMHRICCRLFRLSTLKTLIIRHRPLDRYDSIKRW